MSLLRWDFIGRALTGSSRKIRHALVEVGFSIPALRYVGELHQLTLGTSDGCTACRRGARTPSSTG